jgi:hypothetical protein
MVVVEKFWGSFQAVAVVVVVVVAVPMKCYCFCWRLSAVASSSDVRCQMCPFGPACALFRFSFSYFCARLMFLL